MTSTAEELPAKNSSILGRYFSPVVNSLIIHFICIFFSIIINFYLCKNYFPMPWRRNFKIASLYLAGLMDHDSAVVQVTSRPWIRGFALYCTLDELKGFQAHKFNLNFTSLSYFSFLLNYNTATSLLSFFKILRNSCTNMRQIIQHEHDRATRMWHQIDRDINNYPLKEIK